VQLEKGWCRLQIRFQSCDFVLNDLAHVRKALWMLMLGLQLLDPAYVTKNKSSSNGYQQAQRYLCLFQSQVKLQVRGEEVLDKNGQFILQEVKET
jgi:hypothetical protein